MNDYWQTLLSSVRPADGPEEADSERRLLDRVRRNPGCPAAAELLRLAEAKSAAAGDHALAPDDTVVAHLELERCPACLGLFAAFLRGARAPAAAAAPAPAAPAAPAAVPAGGAGPPAPTPPPSWTVVVRRVADLFVTGRSPARIRRQLGLSSRAVLRAMGEARNRGWLSDVYVHGQHLPGVPGRPKSGVRMSLLDLLRGRVPRGHTLRNVTVLPSRTARADDAGWDERIAAFGRDAAPTLLSLLTRAQYAGVAWGKMVTAAIQGLEDHREADPRSPLLRRDQLLHCVATVGGLIGEPRAEASSSILAARLSLAVNGHFKPVYRLDGGVEGFIAPLTGHPNEVEFVRERTSLLPHYQDVFGGPGRPGVVHKLDAVLTSCGNAHHRSPFWRVALPQLKISPEELNDMTYGNIGGVLLEREDLSAADRARIAEINRRWTGITLRHYEQCARRDPGVVMVALSHNKADVVLKCVELGLVSELIIDEDLGMSLWSRVDPDRAHDHVLELTAPVR